MVGKNGGFQAHMIGAQAAVRVTGRGEYAELEGEIAAGIGDQGGLEAGIDVPQAAEVLMVVVKLDRTERDFEEAGNPIVPGHFEVAAAPRWRCRCFIRRKWPSARRSPKCSPRNCRRCEPTARRSPSAS